MTARSGSVLGTSLSLAALALASVSALAQDEPNPPPAPGVAQEDGVAHVPAFDFPLSEFLGAETRAVLKRQAKESETAQKVCPLWRGGPT